jgi:hypothetical protein
MKNKTLVGIILSGITLLFGYLSMGLFVIQPMGAIPDGATIVYFRLGMNLPFISSADGLLLEKMGSVNLLGRAMMMAGLAKPVLDNKIVSMPYSRSLYLISTNGTEFEK